MGIASSLATLSLSIAGIPCSLHWNDERMARSARQRYSGFLSASAPRLSIDVVAWHGFQQLPPRQDLASRPWLSVTTNGETFRLYRGDFCGELDLFARTARLICFPSVGAVDGFLRLCFSLLLIEEGGLLLHASSVASNGLGYVFTGPSGAGKTTIARMAHGRTLLSDESAIVRRRGDGFVVYGNPFPGELGLPGPNEAFPIGRLCTLQQDSRAFLAAVPRSHAARALLANTLFFPRDSALSVKAFALACDIAERVPIYRLHFARDASLWEVLEC